MNTVRWNPFAEMEGIFGPFRGSTSRLMPRLMEEGGISVAWTPSADISETDKEFLIRAELPGVNKEDIKVSLGDGMITLEGERKKRTEEKNERIHRVESFYGAFKRSFIVPDNVKADAVTSDYKDGVLCVHIPKAAEKKPVQIAVQ